MRAGEPSYIPALSGLRGIAALCVVVSHLAYQGLLPTLHTAAFGALGVMLFFVLSGFLMAHLYLPLKPSPEALVNFGRARFARVYPLFAVTVVVSAILHQADVPFVYALDSVDVLKQLALIEGKSVFWTIVVEFKFYALFAAFWLVTARLSDRARLISLLALYAALWLWLPDGGKESIWQCLQLFIAGMVASLLVRIVEAPRTARIVLPLSLGVFIYMGVAALLLWGDAGPAYRSPALHLYIGLLIWSAAAAGGSFWLDGRAMQRLGDWSFAIYLLHLPVVLFGAWFADYLGINRAWMIVPVLAVVIAISRLSYEYLEAPTRRWLMRGRRVLSPI